MPDDDQDLRRIFTKEFPSKFGQLEIHISKLEGRVGALEQGLAELGATTRSILGEVRDQRSEMHSLADKLHKGTPWAILISLGALILSITATIGVLAIHPIASGLSQAQTDIDKTEQSIISHMSDGHPRRVEEGLSGLGKRIETIEGKRYSDADSGQDANIEFLQNEVTHLRQAAPDVRIQFLEKEFERLRVRLEDKEEQP